MPASITLAEPTCTDLVPGPSTYCATHTRRCALAGRCLCTPSEMESSGTTTPFRRRPQSARRPSARPKWYLYTHTTFSSASGPMLMHWPRDLQVHAVLGGAGELRIEAVHTPHQGNGSGTVLSGVVSALSLLHLLTRACEWGGTKIAECSCVQCARMQ